jgi:hypothetical protein
MNNVWCDSWLVGRRFGDQTSLLKSVCSESTQKLNHKGINPTVRFFFIFHANRSSGGVVYGQRTKVKTVIFPVHKVRRGGFQRLALNLFEPVCDMRRCLNDVTIGLGATASKVTKIHSDKFQTERTEASSRPLVRDAGVAVTVHRVIEWQHAIDYTCLVSKRFQLVTFIMWKCLRSL